MKHSLFLLIVLILGSFSSYGQENMTIETQDIDRFWKAYDLVNASSDSLEQLSIVEREFYQPASRGQKAMFEARNYSAEEYRKAILSYPLFWNSIRPNTNKAKQFASELIDGTSKAYALYPDARPASIYFTVGIFRSPGTTTEDMVLIGVEFAMGSNEVNTSEFPERMDYVKKYHAKNPIKELVFLNTHEFFHTQQTTSFNTTLLTQTLREGVAEFAAVTATGLQSTSEAIKYGMEHEDEVKQAFQQDMFNTNYTYWLWSIRENQFDQRDLSYFIGYQIAEKYYESSEDKDKAIKTLIELDYTNDQEIEDFVNKLRYFNMPIQALKRMHLNNRPTVVKIEEFKNKANNVDPSTSIISVKFSRKMDIYRRGFDYGPLGEENVLTVQKYLGFDADKQTVRWEVSLEPGRQYQVMLSDSFCAEDGKAIVPYLIDITTAKE